ncbi:UrcA family protein [Altericroceibacterium spongiae]|uniref:UrcA family protein n=1 Tax=Altericroceibacterium spongiae TaxID=2320269 RepID=A0A420EED5_9SPHN|nr:UrcA family protein [Altericroceibacterium spongiae]RKF19030.1 UrcA family protein [Altericroceibacterium spongiae]
MIFRTLIFAAAAASTGAIATPAMARPVEYVKVSDLQLTTAEGQAELQHRLDRATRHVCRFDDHGSLRSAREENACFRKTRQETKILVAELVSEKKSKQQLGG